MSGARDAERWERALGEAAAQAVADVEDGRPRADAERALAALAEALGEDDPEPPPDPGLPAGTTVLGVLGRGATGVVYRARQEELGREVAVKVILCPGDAREAERLFAEARRLAALSHPGVVQVFEVGRCRAGVYLAMELQTGGSLQALLARGPLEPLRAARLVRQVAEAVAHVHGRGVMHLDLKPGNVLLDGEGDARVADFGLARELDRAQVSGGATSRGLLGTPEFMAPEQAADRRELLGERTDVHGLGALLYACLAGRPPFRAASLADALHAVRFAEPERLERAAPGTPRDLAAVAAVALEKDPARRYASAAELARDLARFEAGEPVIARPPGALERAWRRLRAHGREVAVAVGAAALTALSLLPLARSGDDEGERWLHVADELAAQGSATGAALVLDELESRDLSESSAAHARALRARLGSIARAGEHAAGAPNAASPLDTDVGSASDESAEPTATAATGGRAAAVVDCWITMDDGQRQRLWSGTGVQADGDVLRIEGRGRPTLPLPGKVTGFDYFRFGPRLGRLPAWAAKVEVGGGLAKRDDGFEWLINDQEVWLGLAPPATSTFVDFASNGLLSGGPNLLEAQRYVWPGGGCTVLIFGELRELADAGTAPGERDVEQWTADMARAVRADLAEGDGPAAWPREERARRAALIDRAIALALLGSAQDRSAAAALGERLARAGVDPADYSDRFFDKHPFSGVTQTGADLGTWLALAAGPDGGSPGAVIDRLPRSASMRDGSKRSTSRLEWLWIGYAALGTILVLSALAIALTGGAAKALTPLGSGLILAGCALDKVVGTPWGRWSLDPLACALLAVAAWCLGRVARARFRLAASLFLVAAAQSALAGTAGLPELRLPLVLAFAVLAHTAPRLAPRGGLRIFGAVAPALLLALYALGLAVGGGRAEGLALVPEYGATSVALAVLIVTGVAATARGKALASEMGK